MTPCPICNTHSYSPNSLNAASMDAYGICKTCFDKGLIPPFDVKGKEEVSSKPSNPKDMVCVRKAPMSTVSAAVMAEIGVAMLEGATKYGRHNYRMVGVRASVYYDALMRHMQAWWEGEDIDPDSGMSHITKAITTLVVLRDAMIMSNVEDDRPPAPPGFYEVLNELTSKIIDRNAHLSPHHYTQKEITNDALGVSGRDS